MNRISETLQTLRSFVNDSKSLTDSDKRFLRTQIASLDSAVHESVREMNTLKQEAIDERVSHLFQMGLISNVSSCANPFLTN